MANENDMMMGGAMTSDGMPMKSMMAEMKKEASMGMTVFLGFMFFFQILINIGSIGAVTRCADEDSDDPATMAAVIFCIVLWMTTICASMWFCKRTPGRLMWFRPMWWTLFIVCLIDLIIVAGGDWHVSIIINHKDKAWIVGSDMMYMTACCYNLGILRGWMKM